MVEKKVLIEVPGGQIEAMVFASASGSNALGVMCHPHSLQGGAMGNKVVTTVVKAWQEMGMNTVRFNFRGVGESSGKFDEGRGEQEDLKQVLNWARGVFGFSPVHLGGFSFGAYVALQFCQHFTPAGLLLIAPPPYPGFENLKLPDCPCDLIVAGQDEIVSTEAVLAWAKTQKFRTIENITDASHFFHGKLLVLRELVLSALGKISSPDER